MRLARTSISSERLRRFLALPEHEPISRLALTVLLLALLTRLLYIVVFETWSKLPGAELVAVARSLAEGRGYESPFFDDGTPSSMMAPGYPTLLGLIYAVFGVRTLPAVLVQQCAASLATCLQFAALPYLSRQLGIGQAAGFYGGLIGAVLPLHPWLETSGEWEAPYAALFFVLSVLWILKTVASQSAQPLRAYITCGGILSAAMLIAPNVGPPLAGLLLLAGGSGNGYRTIRLRRAVAIGLIAVAGLVPWTFRNYMIFGEIVPVRSLFGLEFRLSHNPYARFNADANQSDAGVHRLYHPASSASQRALLARIGELNFSRRMSRDAQVWIRENPSRFRKLMIQRFLGFWGYQNSKFKQFLRISLLCVAIIGGALSFSRHKFFRNFVGAILLIFPVPYYFIQTSERYSYPIYWVLLVLAGYALTCAIQFLRPETAQRGSFLSRDEAPADQPGAHWSG